MQSTARAYSPTWSIRGQRGTQIDLSTSRDERPLSALLPHFRASGEGRLAMERFGRTNSTKQLEVGLMTTILKRRAHARQRHAGDPGLCRAIRHPSAWTVADSLAGGLLGRPRRGATARHRCCCAAHQASFCLPDPVERRSVAPGAAGSDRPLFPPGRHAGGGDPGIAKNPVLHPIHAHARRGSIPLLPARIMSPQTVHCSSRCCANRGGT